MPPTGSTRPRRLISPVIAVSLLTVRPVNSETSAVNIATPADGPVLRDRAGRDVDVDVALLEHRRIDPERRGPPLTRDSAACALSRMTSPSWPVRISPPSAGNAGRLDEQDVAADRGPGEPGRDPGDAGAHRDLALEPARPEDLVQDRPASIRTCCALPSAIFIAALRKRRADLAFEVAHPGFARVVADDRVDRVVGDLGLLGLQPVGGQLAGDQIAPRDLEFLVLGVARQVDDLHAVAQRAGDVVEHVRGA